MNHDDEKQLRILSRFHYVAAVLAGVIPLVGAAYAAFGVAILLGRLPGRAPGSGEAIGWLPVGMGAFVLLVGITAVVLNLACARSLRARKNHTLCLLTSALNCVHFPLGTLLGTFTLIALCRPSVSAAFQSQPHSAPSDGAPPTTPRPPAQAVGPNSPPTADTSAAPMRG